MKTLLKSTAYIAFGITAGLCLIPIQAQAKLTEAQLKERCEKKESRPCFDLAYHEFNKNTPESRKAAVKLFRKACALSKRKARCSDMEVRTTSRAHLWKGDRMPASAKKRSPASDGKLRIVAPKIKSSASRGASPRTDYASPNLNLSNSPSISADAYMSAPPAQEMQPQQVDPNMAMNQSPNAAFAAPPTGTFTAADPTMENPCIPGSPGCEASH